MSTSTMSRFEQARPANAETIWHHPAEAIRLMLRTHQTRRALLHMTQRELSDIGISRATAIAEASRWPWDIGPAR